MSYNSKYFDRKPNSLENAVLDAVNGVINEASVTTDLDDDPKLFKQIERMGVKVKKNGKPQDGYQEVTLSGPQAKIDAANKKLNLLPEAKDMDKVNPDAVKKKFKDRKDKDIDNDGDVDSTDKYLHKRRKAISKAMGEEIIETLDELSPDLLRLMEIDIAKRLAVLKRAQSRTDAAGAAAAKADKRDANVKKGMMPKAGSAADKADIKYRASKARQDRLKRNVATAQDREAEREYQAQKRKRMSQGENYDIGTPENTMAKLDATPGQSQDDWQRQVDTMQKKNASMREALAKVWGVGEGHNPFKEDEHSPDEKKKKVKIDTKTMTGKPITKVEVDPDMKEVKVGKKNVSMREALAKVWGMDEGASPFGKKPLTKEEKHGKTMTGQKPTKVEVEPKMEKK